MPRSPLIHGLSLALRHPRPLLWTYAFNASLAWLASYAIRAQYASVMDSSLGAQGLISGFDLGVVFDAGRRVAEGPHGSAGASLLAVPAYLFVFFLMVPGTLLTYQTNAKIRLSDVLRAGLQSFWSFLRITILALIAAALLVGAALMARNAWANWVDEHVLGRPGFLLDAAGMFVVFLVASVVRLYFDLVEIHTVARAQTYRPSGKADRRVRKTLGPAFRSLRTYFVSSYVSFVALALLGFWVMYLLGLSALHHLAQPRSWPTLVLAQLGLLFLLFTRFWQRGMETTVMENVFPHEVRSNIFVPSAAPSDPLALPRLERRARREPVPPPAVANADPLPEPEPIAPSLDEPDPGVYHHDVKREDLLD